MCRTKIPFQTLNVIHFKLLPFFNKCEEIHLKDAKFINLFQITGNGNQGRSDTEVQHLQ